MDAILVPALLTSVVILLALLAVLFGLAVDRLGEIRDRLPRPADE